jgi:hypothetical protein
MTKRKNISSQDSPTLFDFIQEAHLRQEARSPGSLDIRKQLKAALSDDLRHAKDELGRELSRAQVAARMTDLVHEEITGTTIDNWTAASHAHRLPADYLPAWIQATGGQRAAAETISRYSGLFLLPGPEALRAEIQKLDEQEKQIKQEKLRRQFYLKELERRHR